MPEGHSVHRIARQFDRNFVGRAVAASSPQGRFVEGAHVLDGRTATAVRAVGKQMFLEFDDDLWLRVHLGMYGAWDFAGEIEVDPTIASANGRMGQTNQRGTALAGADPGCRRRELADIDRRSSPRAGARADVGADDGSRRRGRRLAAARRRTGAAAPAHRRDLRRPARSDGVRAADSGRGRRHDREARSRSARGRRRRGRGAVHRGRAAQADCRSACC